MKKHIVMIILTLVFCFHSTPLCASFVEDTTVSDEYSWVMSDGNQKKMAAGMLMWGFFLAIASALIAGFIPNSTSTAAPGPAPTPTPIF